MSDEMYRAAREQYPQFKAQQSLQDQQIAAQFGMQSLGMINDLQQNQAVLVSQTNPDKIVESIILGLQGKQKDINGTIKKDGEPMMNEKGINRIKFILKSVINQNTIYSHLEIQDIGRLMNQLSDDVCDELALNWKEYGITDKTMLDSITDSILIPSYLALKRAEGQNEKNWIGKISVENISNAQKINEPKKEHWWSKFKI